MTLGTAQLGQQPATPSDCGSIDSDALLSLLKTTMRGPQLPHPCSLSEQLDDATSLPTTQPVSSPEHIDQVGAALQSTSSTHITSGNSHLQPPTQPSNSEDSQAPSADTFEKNEVIDLLDSSDSEPESDGDDVVATGFPSTTRKMYNVIDSDSEEEEHDASSSDSEWESWGNNNRGNSKPSSVRRHLVIDDDTEEEDDSSAPPRQSVSNTSSRPLLSSNYNNISTASKTSSTSAKPAGGPKATVFHNQGLPLALQSTGPGSFKKDRENISRSLYKEYNAKIFEGKLPEELEIKWNNRLATTAGMTHYKREFPEGQLPRYSAHIELSSKVLDTVPKLQRTLCHEMCHVAAWLINHTAKPPHGPVFKSWAAKAMRIYPQLDITTCHQYDIFYAFRWQCTVCTQEYGRHSNSIDVTKKACGACRGPLQFLGKFNRDGSPVKSRGPSAFSSFVKENFASEKSRQAPGTPMSDIMKALGKKWTEKQSQQKPGTHPAGKALFPSSSEDSIDLTGGDNGESRITETVVLDFFKLTL